MGTKPKSVKKKTLKEIEKEFKAKKFDPKELPKKSDFADAPTDEVTDQEEPAQIEKMPKYKARSKKDQKKFEEAMKKMRKYLDAADSKDINVKATLDSLGITQDTMREAFQHLLKEKDYNPEDELNSKNTMTEARRGPRAAEDTHRHQANTGIEENKGAFVEYLKEASRMVDY